MAFLLFALLTSKALAIDVCGPITVDIIDDYVSSQITENSLQYRGFSIAVKGLPRGETVAAPVAKAIEAQTTEVVDYLLEEIQAYGEDRDYSVQRVIIDLAKSLETPNFRRRVRNFADAVYRSIWGIPYKIALLPKSKTLVIRMPGSETEPYRPVSSTEILETIHRDWHIDRGDRSVKKAHELIDMVASAKGDRLLELSRTYLPILKNELQRFSGKISELLERSQDSGVSELRLKGDLLGIINAEMALTKSDQKVVRTYVESLPNRESLTKFIERVELASQSDVTLEKILETVVQRADQPEERSIWDWRVVLAPIAIINSKNITVEVDLEDDGFGNLSPYVTKKKKGWRSLFSPKEWVAHFVVGFVAIDLRDNVTVRLRKGTGAIAALFEAIGRDTPH